MNRADHHSYDIVGIGNAIVDVLCHVEDRFLAENDIRRGIMQLIDVDRATRLYELQETRAEVSGGSAANTVAGIAMLGGRGGYIGKVCNDQLGKIFANSLTGLGITYRTCMMPAGPDVASGRSLVLISPDGERSMNTYLGAAEHLSPDDIDEELIAASSWIFLEGYRLDGPGSTEAFRKAVRVCHDAGGKVALTLSDPFCVERNFDAFTELIGNGIDLLQCNQGELIAMFGADDLDASLALAADRIPVVACTRSADGAIIAAGSARAKVSSWPTTVVDVTGAGDLFAAGFLHGMISGRDLRVAAMMGCAAASEVISHVGARPQADLREHFMKLGLAPGGAGRLSAASEPAAERSSCEQGQLTRSKRPSTRGDTSPLEEM